MEIRTIHAKITPMNAFANHDPFEEFESLISPLLGMNSPQINASHWIWTYEMDEAERDFIGNCPINLFPILMLGSSHRTQGYMNGADGAYRRRLGRATNVAHCIFSHAIHADLLENKTSEFNIPRDQCICPHRHSHAWQKQPARDVLLRIYPDLVLSNFFNSVYTCMDQAQKGIPFGSPIHSCKKAIKSLPRVIHGPEENNFELAIDYPETNSSWACARIDSIKESRIIARAALDAIYSSTAPRI